MFENYYKMFYSLDKNLTPFLLGQKMPVRGGLTVRLPLSRKRNCVESFLAKCRGSRQGIVALCPKILCTHFVLCPSSASVFLLKPIPWIHGHSTVPRR